MSPIAYARLYVAVYQEYVYILIDEDKVSDEIMATQGLKQECPLSPLRYSLITPDPH